MKRCIICGEDTVKETRTYKTCPRCQANINSWERRPLAHINRRRENLRVYTERMSTVKKGAK